MVKLGSEGHVQGSTYESRHDGCYICGAFNPNWHVYAKPQNNSTKEPFFPFLEYHQPTASARPIEKETGKVAVCAVCFSFLTQQWRAFEDKETPIVKRIYWLKRPGFENSESFDKDFEQGFDLEEGIVNHVMSSSADVTTKDRHHSKVQSKSQSTAEQEPTEALLFTEKHGEDSPTEPSNAPKVPEPCSVNKKMANLEFCFVCSRQKPKEFMRSVHTRPQLKTETPFYPCLTKHNPAILAKKMDFLGKVLVCEACQKFLFRQWQVFQKNNTPLSERQYQLRSDPSLPRERQSQLSTMVCFICGVTQPATSGRFLYSCKHAPGDPYYPFLNKLKPPPGAMPLTKQGLTRACSGCRKSLHRQWKEFEANHFPEDEREYRIRNDGISAPSSSSPSSLKASFSQPIMNTETISTGIDDTTGRNETILACYTCGECNDESSMRPIYTGQNTNPLKANFYFPFIALLEPPPGSRPLDHIGRTLVCKKCYKFLHIKWEQFEQEQVPPQMRMYAVDGKANIRLKSKSYFCYICGMKCLGAHCSFKLHSYPHKGEGVRDGGPFFPFLASCKPKPSALPISSEGTVMACEICFTNLMVQWMNFESSGLPEESNRWLRKYHIDFIICYLCGKHTPRESCSSVSKSLLTFQTRPKIYQDSLMTNQKQDVVLCDGCRREVIPKDSGKGLYTGSTLHETIQDEVSC